MAGHQCSLCSKSFSRQEHLRRHELSHNDPQFHCSTCSKAFHRKDALHKHELTHQTNGASLLQKGARACSGCAAIKSRCTGDRPCARCSHRKLECVYAPHGPRKAQEDSKSPEKRERHTQNQHQSSYQAEPQQGLLAFAGAHGELQHPQMTAAVEQTFGTHGDEYRSGHGNGQQDPVQQDDGQVFFNASTQSGTLAPSDWNLSGLSTINWLQSDPMTFNEDDWASMFPMFPDDFSFSPSVDLVSPMQQYDVNGPVNAIIPAVPTQPTTMISSPYSLQHPGSSNADSSGAGDRATVASGEYYVDGDAGRLPKTKRRKIMPALKGTERVEEPDFSLEYSRPPVPCTEARLHISTKQYSHLRNTYLQICFESSTFKSFHPTEFPSKLVFQGLLTNYFANFDQTLPFLHFPTFEAKERNCALLLTMMALGSCYLDDEGMHVFTISMHEFVRRYLILSEEQHLLYKETPQVISQIQLLHAVGAGHTQYEPLLISATRALCAATAFCRNEWIRQPQMVEPALPADARGRWLSWIQKEESLRTGFCIWTLDCMWACEFQQSPHMRLEDATSMELPSTERAWSAPIATEWTLQVTGILNSPTLLEALQHLYVDKRLLPHLGEFSRILLIHGLYHRTWQVRTTVTQSLANFEPSAQKQASSEIRSKQPVWPPSVPLFNRWRNSACDCLDILHWSANAMIGAASGMEHPTVLHLHISRIVLLAPMRDIVHFAHYLIRSSKTFGYLSPSIPSPTEADEHRRAIQRWAVQDEYKARLSAIHAGVVFWHVRLFSINAFYEPSTVAHAALLLWALSAFSPKKSPPAASPGDSPSSDVCDIILIDRPTDDELVQQFVRQGDTMHANMTGVGDTFGPRGPRKVLTEAQKLLGTLRSWRGVTEHWLGVLARLEKVTASIGVNTAESRERTAVAE